MPSITDSRRIDSKPRRLAVYYNAGQGESGLYRIQRIVVASDEARDYFMRFTVVAHDGEIDCLVIISNLEG